VGGARRRWVVLAVGGELRRRSRVTSSGERFVHKVLFWFLSHAPGGNYVSCLHDMQRKLELGGRLLDSLLSPLAPASDGDLVIVGGVVDPLRTWIRPRPWPRP
jgi:hypothetical protein